MSDEQWVQVEDAYKRHIESLLPNLPIPIAELVERVSLHDGLIYRVVVDRLTRRLTLKLRCGDLQVGYQDVDLLYSGVEFARLDLLTLTSVVRDRRTELLYDEFDIDEDRNYIHRILFEPAGEISIKFRSLRLNQTNRSDRSVLYVGDPYQETPG
ncbi:hypothetical protein TFLX_00185 [Thermoflexales bacterium]|nr:hypothetical protein TFLX_00185 [Thermoflexales bacterium]